MKPLVILLALLSSGLAIFAEFRSVKESTLFFDWLDSVPVIILWASTFIFIFLAAKSFKVDKPLIAFLPSIVCIIGLCIVYWHSKRRETLDDLPAIFTATTYQIGNDGGFILDFKKDGYLKAEKRDHWAVTYYWGEYSQKNDTIKLDLPLDFKLGKQLVLTDTSLSVINDTIRFDIYKQ